MGRHAVYKQNLPAPAFGVTAYRDCKKEIFGHTTSRMLGTVEVWAWENDVMV